MTLSQFDRRDARHNQRADVYGCGCLMAPAPNANNSVFYCACRWHRGAAAYIERRLRYVSDLWAPWGKTRLAYDHVWARRTLSAMAIEKLIASANIYFDFHVSGADVLA